MMTLLFRSKSCRLAAGDPSFRRPDSPPSHPAYAVEEEDEEEEEDDDEESEYNDGFQLGDYVPISIPFMGPRFTKGREEKFETGRRSRKTTTTTHNESIHQQQSPILGVVVAALRKSIVTCSVEREDHASAAMEISWPTDVRHISHVTFDRFNGFLGLPLEFQPEVPSRAPSASVRVFGVSPQSMQCSIDQRGNSVPTILLRMQKRLYAERGLLAEGIFRINADNSQEECVRRYLNKGVIPRGIDVHCLAGLIKAWFRELPKGVLDSLRPDQVVHCNTEAQCTELVKSLPHTEAALLDWAINLMADIVEYEHLNKMNARNIAMVFAPNMTQMADPLTALIHAVQVMNFLKTLIVKILSDREESASVAWLSSASSNSPEKSSHPPHSPDSDIDQSLMSKHEKQHDGIHSADARIPEKLPTISSLLRSITLQRLEYSSKQMSSQVLKKYGDDGKLVSSISCSNSPITPSDGMPRTKRREAVGMLDRLNVKKGMKKIRQHPIFQLSRSAT